MSRVLSMIDIPPLSLSLSLSLSISLPLSLSLSLSLFILPLYTYLTKNSFQPVASKRVSSVKSPYVNQYW